MHTILTIAAILLVGSLARAEGLAIVVGKKTSLDSATTAELVKYFKAEKSKLPDGTKIAILVREPGSPERAAALSGIYQMTDAEYQKYFLQATFTGAVAAAPKQLTSATAVKAYIAATVGAIGFIKASDVDDSVKVVKIDGKTPDEAGYSLQIK
jgi:hypothetical protein